MEQRCASQVTITIYTTTLSIVKLVPSLIGTHRLTAQPGAPRGMKTFFIQESF